MKRTLIALFAIAISIVAMAAYTSDLDGKGEHWIRNWTELLLSENADVTPTYGHVFYDGDYMRIEAPGLCFGDQSCIGSQGRYNTCLGYESCIGVTSTAQDSFCWEYNSCKNLDNSYEAVCMADNACRDSTVIDTSFCLGYGACWGAASVINSTCNGYNTCSSASNVTQSTCLGEMACSGSVRLYNDVCIGKDACVDMEHVGNNYGSVVLGYQAGDDSINNGDNVFIGTMSGIGAGDGSGTMRYNTAIGFDSFDTVASGTYNLALGPMSFNGATGSASHNTCIGEFSCYQITGSNNTVLGGSTSYNSAAGRQLSGSHNNCVGEGACKEASGNYNDCFGGASCWKIKGANNTAIGYGTGYDSQGDYNVFVGQGAGSYGVDTDHNMMFGYNVGASSCFNSYSGGHWFMLGDDASCTPYMYGSMNTGSTSETWLHINALVGLKKKTSDPCGGDAATEGRVFWNSTSHYACACDNAGAAKKLKDESVNCF